MGFGNKVHRSERFNEIAYAWLKEKLTYKLLAIVLHFKSELWKLGQFSTSPWDL